MEDEDEETNEETDKTIRWRDKEPEGGYGSSDNHRFGSYSIAKGINLPARTRIAGTAIN